MITVSSQEIATFLGDHVDQELQRSGVDFGSIVASCHGGFRAGCALMDVLNKVEEVQARIREALKSRDRDISRQALEAELLKVRVASLYLLYGLYNYLPIQQNPFLCFLVDLYTTALHDDHLKPERFVTSIILNGDGEELAPSTPSELITIAQEVGSKSVQLQIFDEYLPEVSIKDQVVPGLGWKSFNPSQGRRGDRQGIWETFLLERHNRLVSATLTLPSTITPGDTEKEDEETLEEWEIEAEKRFTDAEDAPPAPRKTAVSKLKKVEEAPNRQQLNSIMEQASVQALTFDQEQLMLTQFAPDTVKVHIPLPPLDALPGIVDNNPTIAFNLLLHLIQMSSDLDTKGSGKAQNGKSSKSDNPEPSIVDGYLDTMTHSKRLTLHSLEVVNRLTGATSLSPQFLHAYIENAIRCCEMVDDKVGQARVVRMLCVFLQSLLRNDVITIPGYYHALQSFCVQFSRVKEVATLFQTLVEFQRKMDGQSPVQENSDSPTTTTTTSTTATNTATTNGNGNLGGSRTSWLANSGSISHAKPLSKPGSLNGFSTPGALSQFIHQAPSSPSPGSTNGHSSFFKTHHKHSSQHSSASGSLFSTPTVMSASVSAFNSGFGNSGLALGSSGSKDTKDANGGHGHSHSFSQSIRRSGGLGERDYDLEAALRASLKDMEAHSGSPSSASSSGHGSGTASGTVRTPNNGISQQLQPSQLGKGFHSSHHGSQPRGRGARRGG
ncbi:hypothetical protein BGZ82_000889 [Podila clonocystis]|nr:hypothetical protein BGZ82_000889 [Podila clonocystis]